MMGMGMGVGNFSYFLKFEGFSPDSEGILRTDLASELLEGSSFVRSLMRVYRLAISCLSLRLSLVAPLASSNMMFHSLKKGRAVIPLASSLFFLPRVLISSSSSLIDSCICLRWLSSLMWDWSRGQFYLDWISCWS